MVTSSDMSFEELVTHQCNELALHLSAAHRGHIQFLRNEVAKLSAELTGPDSNIPHFAPVVSSAPGEDIAGGGVLPMPTSCCKSPSPTPTENCASKVLCQSAHATEEPSPSVQGSFGPFVRSNEDELLGSSSFTPRDPAMLLGCSLGVVSSIEPAGTKTLHEGHQFHSQAIQSLPMRRPKQCHSFTGGVANFGVIPGHPIPGRSHVSVLTLDVPCQRSPSIRQSVYSHGRLSCYSGADESESPRISGSGRAFDDAFDLLEVWEDIEIGPAAWPLERASRALCENQLNWKKVKVPPLFGLCWRSSSYTRTLYNMCVGISSGSYS